ncbi:MAG: DNA gyrase inhibitor YacG [Nitrospirota bacterium]
MRIVCPICKTKTTWEENPWRPFCSERCKLIDLGKWVQEEYKIEGRPAEGEEPAAERKEAQ